jgi:hypothetical protein
MTATPTGVSLLSCLRALGSSTELVEVPDAYFTEPEELGRYSLAAGLRS